MTTGKDSWDALGVPLYGDFKIIGRQGGAYDIMTIEAVGSATGDYIVCRSSDATEALVVEDSGKVVGADGATFSAGDVEVTAGDVQITNGYFLRFTSWPVTALTSATIITLGDVWLMKTSTYVQFAIAESTSVIRYINTTSA